MFNCICTFPLPSDLLAQAIHPTSPLLALGLASGHVQIVRLPALPPNSSQRSRAEASSTNGHGTVETAWRTRRHKGSCRTLAFTLDGSQLFSAGTDGIVKAATTETGEVTGKIAVPRYARPLPFSLSGSIRMRNSFDKCNGVEQYSELLIAKPMASLILQPSCTS